jgi:Amt family ammonium transporter
METMGQSLDIAWILICAALVMLMQAGFSCLESGLVRSKNSINVAAKNFADFCLSSAIFWLFGFGVMFGVTANGLFGTSGFLFGDTTNPWLMAFFIFQLGFCGTATTIVSGAVAERMRFGGYLLVATIISAVIYPVIGHWVWGSAAGIKPGGWLEQMGFIDFAGSTVVHSVGGWISLAAIIIIGPRIGRFGSKRTPIHGHDIPIVTLGVFLLWFGWFGFNGGSTLGLTPEVPSIIVNTTISGAFGGVVAMALSWRFDDHPDVTVIMNGSLAGLVGITASAHIMTPLSAVIIGSIAAVVMYVVTLLLERFEIDDVVGAVPVHLSAGIWGTLAVAIFADPEKWGTGLGRWEQLVVQATGVGATFVWAFGVGFVLLWLINRWVPLRIDPRGERTGLNVAEHGASTEILDLLTDMDAQRRANDYSQPVNVEPHTEIGQIAQQYNRVLADINTEQTRREAVTEDLKQQTNSLQLLQGTADAANRAKTIDQAIQTCLESICEFGGWSIGHCFLADEQGETLRSAGVWHLDDLERYGVFQDVTEKIDIGSGGGFSSLVLTSGEPQWLADVSEEKNFIRARVAKDVGIKGAAAFPVLVGEDVVAVLEFFSPEPRQPNEAVLEVMASVGTQLGRIVERERSEAARFKTLVDHMPANVNLRDRNGKFILINRDYEEFHGVTNGFVRGKTLKEVAPHMMFDIAVEKNLAMEREVIDRNVIVAGEYTYMRGGEERIFTDTKFPINDPSGEVTAVGGIQLDVTELKRAEKKLHKAYETIKDQKERMEDELNIGREIQMGMVPLVFPPFPDRNEFSIFAALEPAREVGGDFYDFYFIDDDKLCVCIGDVSGKGVPAALFMAMAKTLIKSRANDDRSTASILTHVNEELSLDNKNSMFVTIFAAILNLRTGELVYTNAGHNPPYIKRKDGTLQRLDERHGPVVGAMDGIVYTEGRIAMESGDMLYLYTDGVTEAMNAKDRLFSEKRLIKKLAAKSIKEPKSSVTKMIDAVKAFAGDAEQADDITVLALAFHGSAEDEALVQQRIVIKNQLLEINAVNKRFASFAEDFGIPPQISTKFNIIFDELLNNVISYAYRDDNEHDIEVKMEAWGNRLVVTITDDGVPFNPLNVDTPDTSLSLEEREIGGMGIHLVRNLIGDVSYQRHIGKNITTMIEILEHDHDTKS